MRSPEAITCSTTSPTASTTALNALGEAGNWVRIAYGGYCRMMHDLGARWLAHDREEAEAAAARAKAIAEAVAEFRMENRRPVLCVVPFQTLGVSPSGGPTAVGEADLNLTDPQGRQHILDGDGPGSGGHGPGRGIPGKSEFPGNWSDQRVLNEISDIATDPNQTWSSPNPGNGYITTVKTVDGIKIKVVYDPGRGRIVTGYPTNVGKNP